ncbi:hypothetical protein ALC57_00266 [Trachymyrmex cornetzi]|uniref:HAT C-terminal dimerisation domain-containing protein n=1 Tax=Trachymyrmex cornetzi TaxID=471704 RepID=A0A151JSZ2_9HYME|nr:hypothetical protein ALC57_00266 [Trachymyrmex cornetzi]
MNSESEENIQSLPDTPPKTKLKTIQKHRQQKFRNAWLVDDNFKTWLSKVPNNCKKVKKFELKLCAFLAEHNMSFRALDHLTPLIKECITDSEIVRRMHLKSTKGTAVIKNVIGLSEKEHLRNKLQSCYFSVLIDESTDIAAVKTMCIIVRYFDIEELQVVSKFWDLCQVFEKDKDTEGATAEHLFNLLRISLESQDISFDNIMGFASDGCNTMMGSQNSVASRFMEKCPGIFIFKCICHSLHLCASEACKELPRTCEALARKVYNEFKNSAKRQYHFQEFQDFLDIEVHKILRPSQTRWLSLYAIVNRILEQWDALKLYFREQMLTARLHSVEQIVQAFDNPITKLYYLFLQWVLPKFTKLNELFQSRSVVLTSLHEKMSVNYRELLETYLCKNYIYRTALKDIDPFNEEKHLRPEQMYFGVKVMEMLSTPAINNNEHLKADFRSTCVKFLAIGCNQIKQRFNFDDPILMFVTNLSPSKAMLRSTRDNVLSLLPLMKLLPRIVDLEEYQDIDDEWRQLPLYELPVDINPKGNVDLFWAKLMFIDDNDQGLTFKKLSKFVLDVLSLPHSNADCERLFSQINLIKTKTRNKLITSTINGLLLTKQRVQGNCLNYEPSKQEYSCMTKALMYPKITDIHKGTTCKLKSCNVYEENDELNDFNDITIC